MHRPVATWPGSAKAGAVNETKETPAPHKRGAWHRQAHRAAGAGSAGRRLWRHRHQPAVRAARVLHAGRTASPPRRSNVLGVLSLIVWALIIIVSVKYLAFVMRADNRGEGGILALMALVSAAAEGQRGAAPGAGQCSLLLGIFGAALLYGDGIITPAISVLSAVEGLSVATAVLRALRHPHHADHPGGALPGAAARHGGHRQRVRALHVPVVRRAGGAGGEGAGAQPRRCWWRCRPLHAVQLLRAQREARLPGAGRGVPGGDGRRGALRGHGPLRPRAHPPGRGSAWCCPRCCSTTSGRGRCC